MNNIEKTLGKTIIDDVLMVVLALLSVFLLVFEVLAEQNIEQQRVLDYADLIIASIFLAEFSFNLITSDNKKTFLKGHWWELLASIPITSQTAQVLRGLRILRIFRLIRLLRLIRVTRRIKIVVEASERISNYGYIIYTILSLWATITAGSLGFHYFEAGVNANVHNYFDSVWWAIVTMTTIGYGNIYPVTVAGRLIAIVLMFTGIGTLGLFTGAIASYFVRSKNETRLQ